MVKRSMKSEKSAHRGNPCIECGKEMHTETNQQKKKNEQQTDLMGITSDANGNERRKAVFLDHIRFITISHI